MYSWFKVQFRQKQHVSINFKYNILYIMQRVTWPTHVWESTNHSVCLVFRDIRYSVAHSSTFQCTSKTITVLRKLLLKEPILTISCQLMNWLQSFIWIRRKMSLAPHSGSFRASQQSCSVTARDESPYVSIFTSLLKTQFTQKEDLLNHLLAFMLFTICLTLVFQWRAQKGDVK